MTDSTGMTRRRFCNHLLVTSAGLVLAKSTAAGVQDGPLVVYPPMKIEGAERLMPGGSLYFDYPTARDAAVLVRLNTGEYVAYNRKCAHRGCSIDFDIARSCFMCPCHKGAYDVRTGQVIYGPPPRPLDQIVLQMRGGGQLWAVGKRLAGTATVPIVG